MTVRNATEFVVLCENTLGWVPDTTQPLWKARVVMAGRVNRAIKKDPARFTWHNLELAVALLRRERQPIKSPLYVFYHVDDAVAAALSQEARPLGERIDEAIAACQAEPSEQAQYWVGRLTRASGPARQDVYDQWHTEWHAQVRS